MAGTASYPPREPCFAYKFCRKLAKRTAAQEIGAEACWLLTIVAMTEDARWYSGAVTFYNMQLAAMCGFDSENRLARHRAKAVDAGWLHYEAGGKRKPGVYWVTVPEGGDTEDTPIDEGADDDLSLQNGGTNGGAIGGRNGFHLQNGGAIGGRSGGEAGDNRRPSYPIPNPNPNPNPNTLPPPRLLERSAPAAATVQAKPEGDGDGRKDSAEKTPDRFTEAFEAVKACGVRLAHDAVQTARRNGFSIDGILAVVDVFHAEPGKWTEGALYERLTAAGMAEFAAHEGWVSPNPDWQKRQPKPRAKAVESPPAELPSTLEPIYGDRLDRMTDQQIADLVRDSALLTMRDKRDAPRVGKSVKELRAKLLAVIQHQERNLSGMPA